MPLQELIREFQGPEAVTRMLTYAVRCPDVAAIALSKLHPQDFNKDSELQFQVIWLSAREYWLQYKSIPPLNYMLDMSISVLKQLGFVEPLLHTNIRTIIQHMYEYSENPWNAEYGKDLLRAFLGRVFTTAVQHVTITNPGDAKTVIDLVTNEYHRRNIGTMAEVDPFDFGDDELLVANARKPLYVEQVDLLLGGGLVDSECVGILGPTGGGKTTLALQIAGNMAAHQKNVLYFTYEQPAGELRPRILSMLTRLPVATFADKTVNDLDEHQAKIVRGARDLCRKYVTLIDRSTDGDNIIEIDSKIQHDVAVGKRPSLVIIDWIWILVTRYATVKGKTKTPERQCLMEIMDGIKSISSKYRVPFLILQQLSTEQAKKSPGRKPQWFNSAEAGNFAWLLAYCFAIGKTDSRGYCYLVGSKARNAKRQDVVMQLIGELNRFDIADRGLQYKEGKGFRRDDEVDAFDGEITKTDESTQDENMRKYEVPKDIA